MPSSFRTFSSSSGWSSSSSQNVCELLNEQVWLWCLSVNQVIVVVSRGPYGHLSEQLDPLSSQTPVVFEAS